MLSGDEVNEMIGCAALFIAGVAIAVGVAIGVGVTWWLS